jgi:hypothetical protein
MAEREADQGDTVAIRSAKDDKLPLTDPDQHHHISKTQRYPINVMKWMKENEHDLAVKVSQYKFISSQLKILSRIFYPNFLIIYCNVCYPMVKKLQPTTDHI